MALFTKIDEIISTLDLETITNQRKETLQPLVDYLKMKMNDNKKIRLNFIK